MKFVALISGGKDSCFNTMECVRHGHELVCLGNLYPATAAASAGEVASDETDSFMYQSAGHTAIEAQAECFGKPLVRRQISGEALNQSLQYLPTEKDEVEDLFLLLKDVNEQFPEVEAVGSGAVLSNYQRTRVENVCERLGLTSLAYLWRRPQSTLLDEMVEAGVDAILVKVASFGLEPSKHLGKSLARLRPHFETLHKRCGFHVCGEGGEYETLTLDCPLFVRRLILDETMVVKHSDDMFAPVGLLRVIECHSAPKDEPDKALIRVVEGDHNEAGPPSPLRRNANGGENRTPDNRRQQRDSTRRVKVDAPISEVPPAPMAAPRATFLPHVHEGSGGFVSLSGVRSPGFFVPTPAPVSDGAAFEATVTRAELSATLQAARVLASVRAALDAVGVSMRDVCFAHVYLRDMDHFAAFNAEYCRWFDGVNPPSRSCVAVPLPSGCWIMLDVVALRGSGAALLREGSACEHRQVLHVRSISNWAPVCIGPYCQANTLAPGNAITLIAGQIGLQPASMTLPPRPSYSPPAVAAPAGTKSAPWRSATGVACLEVGGSFHGAELKLCVSHASAVASAVGASLARGCVFATLYVSEEAAKAARAEAAGSRSPGVKCGREKSSRGNGAKAGGSCGKGGGEWLRGMVEECRSLMEARSGQEEAEARAEKASMGLQGDEDDDSAEEGWTSDPEELAKEAARKTVLSRRVPILTVVVPSLPKNSAVELEVMCMSRAALLLLPCKHYPPSMRRETLAEPKQSSFPIPTRFVAAPPRALKYGDRGNGEGIGGDGGTVVISATTTGSTVDRILCVVETSLSVVATKHLSGGATRGTGAVIASTPTSGSVYSSGLGIDEGSSPAVHGNPPRGEATPTSNPRLSGLALTGVQLERALALVLEGTSEALSSARLRWRDVSHLRVYYYHNRAAASRVSPSREASTAGSGSSRGVATGSEEALATASRAVAAGGIEEEEELLERAVYLALAATTLERPAITFVPATGIAAVEGIIVSVHATALSLDRLRTELWVRGRS